MRAHRLQYRGVAGELDAQNKKGKPGGLPFEIADLKQLLRFDGKRAYFFGAAALAAASAYFFVKRSTRPAVSISFCLPVKNGWQFEQISTFSVSPLMVDRVGNELPHAQCTLTEW